MKEHFFPNGKVTPERVLDAVRSIDPARHDLFRNQDDISIARLFAEIFRDVACYNVTSRSWGTYNGIVWKNDVEGMNVEQFAKLLSRSLLIYSADVGEKSFSEFACKLQDRRRREIMIKDSRDFTFCDRSQFDSDPLLFNTQNCVIDLRTGKSMDHDPTLRLSKVSNVVYDPEVRSEDFERFISEIMQNDADKIKYLQKIFGYCLTGTNPQEEAYIVYGATTRNGKSTLLDTIEYLFGDYACNIMPETLAQQKDKNSRQASGDIARLDGIRLVHCGEPPKRMKFDVALLKSMTGGDQITARHLNEREFQFKAIFKLLINTNFLPLVTDDTLFSSDRLHVISFDRHFNPEEQDVHLKERLRSPENLSGIFNWCLDGLRMYQEEGETLYPPESVVRATDDYRAKSDKLKCFMQDALIPDRGSTISVKRTYTVYAEWCRDNGYGVENKSNFLDEIRSKGLLSPTGTIDGQTVRNVIRGFAIDESLLSSPLEFLDNTARSDD